MAIQKRQKGNRTFQKAMKYAKSQYPLAVIIPIYQVSRFAQAQPFDALILSPLDPPRLIEIRSNIWRVAAPQTRALAALPGLVIKQIWRFMDGSTTPDIRTWNGTAWV